MFKQTTRVKGFSPVSGRIPYLIDNSKHEDLQSLQIFTANVFVCLSTATTKKGRFWWLWMYLIWLSGGWLAFPFSLSHGIFAVDIVSNKRAKDHSVVHFDTCCRRWKINPFSRECVQIWFAGQMMTELTDDQSATVLWFLNATDKWTY